jgi:hypothetical protein
VKRLLIVIAATCCLAGLVGVPPAGGNPATPVRADAAAPGDPKRAEGATGGVNEGTYYDFNFTSQDQYIFSEWCREANCGSDWTSGHIITQDISDINGHNACIQVAFDWDRPNGHYDVRVYRNCDPNSDFDRTWTEDDAICDWGSVPTECDLPMRRVQIAKYVPATGVLIDASSECRFISESDCDNWEGPRCQPDACLLWIRYRDGTTLRYYDSDPTHSDCCHVAGMPDPPNPKMAPSRAPQPRRAHLAGRTARSP